LSSEHSFNPFARVWQPYPEYFNSPWDYYCSFIKLLKSKSVRFATMSEALEMDDDVVKGQVIALIDHHIDFYPIETEVMARWEQKEEIVSSIYLFNVFDYGDTSQLKDPWNIEELNIKFYQSLEQSGFEIGYHQNAVGLVRVKRDGRLYQKNISDCDLELAKKNFQRDVDGLRQYFNIRTYIPHGAGEANNQLMDLPDGYDDLVWVYNNTRKNGTAKPPIKWRNFSDSVGVDTQKISGFGARFNVNRDNLHIKAHLMDVGFHHILVHSGRFSSDMALDDYSGEINIDNKHVNIEFKLPYGITAPISTKNLLSDEIIQSERKQLQPHIDRLLLSESDLTRKYYVLSDNKHFALANLKCSDKAIVNFLHHSTFSNKDKNTSVYRGVGKPNEIFLPTLSLVEEIGLYKSCEKLMNDVYCPNPLRFLARSKFPFSVIYLEKVVLSNQADIKHLVSIIRTYSKLDYFYIKVDIQCFESLWEKIVNKLVKKRTDQKIIKSISEKIKEELNQDIDNLYLSTKDSCMIISSLKKV